MELRKAVEKVLNKILELKKDESLLVVADKEKKNIAKVFFEQGKKITDKIKLIEIPIAENHGQEPPEKTAKEMQVYDVLILITSKSLTHTKARVEASRKGARVVTMPNIKEDTLIRFSNLNLKKMFSLGDKIKEEFFKIKKGIRVTTEKGTDFSFDIKTDKRFYTEMDKHKELIFPFVAEKVNYKGSFGNIPCGEACWRPEEGTFNGKVVIDVSILDELVDKPIEVVVNNGVAVSIKGAKTAEKLKKALDKFGKKAYVIAELGIGINDAAKIIGNILEDEKVMGTCHVAFGNNYALGGNNYVPIHLDGIIDKPTIYFDDKKIMEKGKFLINSN